MNRAIRWYDYITINIYYLGISTLSQTLTPLVLPLLVQKFVGEAQKGTSLGTIRLWGLMVALLVQALMGILSDRSPLRWGRRRPFILAGTLGDLVFIAAIGFSATMSEMNGYWFLFAAYLLLQVASNTAHAAQQGFIPDLIPEHQRGRFSSIKAVFEVPLPVILVSFAVAPFIKAGNMWGGLVLAAGVLVAAMLITMLTREDPLQLALPKLDWTPFLRLALMTGLFTIIILAMGEAVKLAGLAANTITSITGVLVVMGAAGLAAMAIAVALGVWISVRISVGAAAGTHRSFTWWVVNRLAFLVGIFNLSTFAVYFLQARLGFSQDQAAGPAAQLMMVVGVFVLIFALLSGWLADRFGHKRVVAVSCGVAALGTLVTILGTDLGIIFVGGGLIGAAAGLFYTANWALGTELVPKEEAGRYLGISNLAGAGAGAVGAYIGGPIADYFTARVPDVPGLGYVLLFAIYGVMFLLALLALARVYKLTPKLV